MSLTPASYLVSIVALTQEQVSWLNGFGGISIYDRHNMAASGTTTTTTTTGPLSSFFKPPRAQRWNGFPVGGGWCPFCGPVVLERRCGWASASILFFSRTAPLQTRQTRDRLSARRPAVSEFAVRPSFQTPTACASSQTRASDRVSSLPRMPCEHLAPFAVLIACVERVPGGHLLSHVNRSNLPTDSTLNTAV